MSATAAVLTGKGPGAIATIKLCGPSSSDILGAIFHPSVAIPSCGKLAVGRIADGPDTVDHVVLACESEGSFAINCHGSPLVVELLMELLGRHGAAIVESQAFIRNELSSSGSMDFLAVEAALAQLDSLTIEGTRLIANQLTSGLSPLAHRWLKTCSGRSLETVKSEAAVIIARSQIARFIIHGARVVLAGPPNSGKSTLLNCLTGRATSIVADQPGTTRDYVTARLTAPAISMEVVDTAGLGNPAASMHPVDMAAQNTSRRLLASADLVLLVLDSTRPISQFDASILEGRPTVTVLNKRDIVPLSVPGTISISATFNENIASVIIAIREKLGIETFDLTEPACFTQRQHNIMHRLISAADAPTARDLITELINGPLSV